MYTTELKQEAKNIIRNNQNKPIRTFIILSLIPLILCTLIVAMISSAFHSKVLSWILTTTISLIGSFFAMSYIKFVNKSLNNKVKMEDSWISIQEFITLAIIIIISQILDGIKFHNPIVDLLFTLAVLVFINLYVVVQNIIFLLNDRVTKVVWIGIKLGFRYFFRTIWLTITFIPLYLVIGITLGILGIWKIPYITTTTALYVESLLEKENIKREDVLQL